MLQYSQILNLGNNINPLRMYTEVLQYNLFLCKTQLIEYSSIIVYLLTFNAYLQYKVFKLAIQLV